MNTNQIAVKTIGLNTVISKNTDTNTYSVSINHGYKGSVLIAECGSFEDALVIAQNNLNKGV